MSENTILKEKEWKTILEVLVGDPFFLEWTNQAALLTITVIKGLQLHHPCHSLYSQSTATTNLSKVVTRSIEK